MGLSFKGRLDFANGVDHLLGAASAYSIAVKEVTDLGGDQVLAVIQATMKGKGSEVEVSQTVFSLITLRERLIVRAEESLDRAEALEAAGMSE